MTPYTAFINFLKGFLLCVVLGGIVLYIIVLHPDIVQPVAKGLSGHYYIEGDDLVIRCYDLTKSTRSVICPVMNGHENMTAWNVNCNNTRFIAAYSLGNDNYIRWYDIRDSKLVIDGNHPYTMPVPHCVTDISISPDGKTCALIMNLDVTFQLDFMDLEKCTKSSIRLPAYRPNHPAPRWDQTGRKFVYVDRSKHMVMYDVDSRTNTVLADTGFEMCISPNGKLVYLDQFKDDPSYLRRLDDNSKVQLNTNEPLVNWSPDSQGYDYHSLHAIRYSLHYYDIKAGRSYRMPVPFNGTITRWVK